MDWEVFKQQMKTSPGKTMRFVAGLALTLIILWVMVLVQSGSGSSDAYVDLNNIQGQAPPGVSTSEQAASAGSNTNAEIPVGSLLLVILLTGGGIYMYVVYKKKISGEYGAGYTAGRLVLEEKLEIAPGILISVIRVNGGYWVVSCGGSGVELLQAFTRDEWQAYQPETVPDKPGYDAGQRFSGLLKTLKQNDKKGI